MIHTIEICKQHCFMPGKNITDTNALFVLKMLIAKYRKGWKELCASMDLEKAYDTIPREELWYFL